MKKILLIAAFTVQVAFCQFGNAKRIQGNNVCVDDPTATGQAIVWDATAGCYKPGIPGTASGLNAYASDGLANADCPSGSCAIGTMYKVTGTANVKIVCNAAGVFVDLANCSMSGCTTYPIQWTNSALIAASTTADITLATLPPLAKVAGVTVWPRNQFSDGAGAMSAVTVSVGDGTTADLYASALAAGEAATISNAWFQDSVEHKSSTMASSSIVARLTATGRNFGDGAATYLTGGLTWVTLCLRGLPQPSSGFGGGFSGGFN